MKKIYILLCVVLFATQLFSQRSRRSNIKWISVAGVGEFGNSVLFNYAVENDENVSQKYININYAIGGKLGVTFGEAIDLSVEALNHTFYQQYDVRPLTGGTYSKNLKFNTLDLGVIFRYTTFAGVYFEFGPRFSSIKTVDSHISKPYEIQITGDSIYSSGMVKSITAGLGFVVYSSSNDRFRVNFGIRGSYAFDDILDDNTVSIVSDELYNPVYENRYETQQFTVTTKLELVFYPAYYGKSGCGKSRWVFFK